MSFLSKLPDEVVLESIQATITFLRILWVSLKLILSLRSSVLSNTMGMILTLLDLLCQLCLLLFQLQVENLKLLWDAVLLVLEMTGILLVLTKAEVEPWLGSRFSRLYLVLIAVLILLLGFHDQRLELKLSGHEALVDHLLLLLYLCLKLSKLSLLVLEPEGQLIDGLVVVQKFRLILFAELLGGLLLRVLELRLNIFELSVQVHFLVAEVLNQFFDLSKIVIFARTLRFQLKFQRADLLSVLSELVQSHLRLLEVSQSLKILLIILVLLGLDR